MYIIIYMHYALQFSKNISISLVTGLAKPTTITVGSVLGKVSSSLASSEPENILMN